MRYALLAVLLLSALLSGCGGAPPEAPTEIRLESAPTTDGAAATDAPPAATDPSGGVAATPDPNNSNVASGEGLATNPPSIAGVDSSVVIVTVRPTLVDEVPFEGVGTLSAPATEDPDLNIPFEWISMRRLGGEPNPDGTQAQTEITIYADGRAVGDGVEGRTPQATIDLLNLYVRELNFFNVQNTFIGPLGADDITTYLYAITVRRNGAERQINAMEGFTPPELDRLIGTLVLEGQRIMGAE
jgi:hypothetical protein